MLLNFSQMFENSTIWIVLCGILLVMFITLSIYQRMASKQLQRDLQRRYKPHDLPDNLDKWIAELNLAKQLVQQERDLLPKRQRDEFDKQFYERMLHYNNFSAFQHLINSKLDAFSTRLEARIPNLSEKELTLLYLLLLQVPNDDILLLTDYAPTSLPTTKQRLCKKLGISHVNNLSSTLASWV